MIAAEIVEDLEAALAQFARSQPRAAYFAAKADLLTRIADQHIHQIASHAQATAQRAATPLPTIAQETP